MSVREEINSMILMMLSDFNTTACVGSRSSDNSDYDIVLTFQYNCLCRFEVGELQLGGEINGFQYNCLCRFEHSSMLRFVNYILFQYNCLCRFELSGKHSAHTTRKISIQLLVSVRDFLIVLLFCD